MRKLLSFILAFTMLFTSVAASAAMSSDKIPAFLDKAGIVAEGTFADETALITRGEFAKLVAKLIPIENYKGLSTTQIFKDVPVDSPIFDVTTLLYQMYFVVGDGNGNFEPDALLTAEAACKILVNLMGDQYFAQYYGGYIPAAAAKGLLSGVGLEANTNVTAKAALKLIYNTLRADISNSNMYDGNATTNNPEKEMFMSKRLGIYMTEGTVIDDGVTGLIGDSSIDKGQIKIGQSVFENQTGMEDLLGYTVEGFYKYDEDADKNILIFAYVNENKTDIIELDYKDIATYSALKYEYYVDEAQNDTEEAFLNANYRLIYNGHAYSTETKEASFTKTMDQMIKPENGNVKLVDTDGDGKYDLVMVTDYTIVVVENVDAEAGMIYGNPNYTDVDIDLSKAKNDLIITNKQGALFDLASMNSGVVLSVAKTADGKRARIKYSNEKLTGILSTMDGNSYYIGETEYIATKTYSDYVTANPSDIAIGRNMVFYFTFDNELVYSVNEEEDSVKVGYLINLHYKNAMDDVLTIRLLTDGSSISDFTTADRVVVDGRLYKSKETLANYLVGFKTNLIRYRVNGDGKINYIDTPYDIATGNPNYLTESDDTLHIMRGANDEEIYYNSKANSFSDRFVLDGRAKAFVIPRGQSIENAYVTDYSNSKISSRGSYKVTAYATKTGGLYAEHVVYSVNINYTKPHSQDLPTYGVITKVRETINDEGNPVKKVTITDGDEYLEYMTESDTTLVCQCGLGQCTTNPIVAGVGDVVAYTLDGKMIRDDCIIVCYDYSQGKVVNPGSQYYFEECEYGIMHDFDISKIQRDVMYLTDVNCVLPFYINRVERNAAELVFDYWLFRQSSSTNTSLKLEEFSPNPTKRVYNIASTLIIEVNTKANIFEPIRVNDIKKYNDGNGVIEKGVLIANQGAPIMMVYYK